MLYTARTLPSLRKKRQLKGEMKEKRANTRGKFQKGPEKLPTQNPVCFNEPPSFPDLSPQEKENSFESSDGF